MARQPTDREDLMRDAVGLVPRLELTLPGETTPIFAGFRKSGGLSVYFQPDLAFHFTSNGELRRAIWHDALYKAEQGNLIELRREEYDNRTELQSRQLTAAEVTSIWDEFEQRAEKLRNHLTHGSVMAVRQTPSGENAIQQLLAWLTRFDKQRVIAAKPNVA